MANYYSRARSNYFKVKDEEAFKEFCEQRNLVHIENGKGGHGFLAEEGVPSEKYDHDTGDIEEFDIYTEIVDHIAEGEVAIIQEVGYEKLRYLTGDAYAINSKGEVKIINLHDIYKLAEELTDNKDGITEVSY